MQQRGPCAACNFVYLANVLRIQATGRPASFVRGLHGEQVHMCCAIVRVCMVFRFHSQLVATFPRPRHALRIEPMSPLTGACSPAPLPPSPPFSSRTSATVSDNHLGIPALHPKALFRTFVPCRANEERLRNRCPRRKGAQAVFATWWATNCQHPHTFRSPAGLGFLSVRRGPQRSRHGPAQTSLH